MSASRPASSIGAVSFVLRTTSTSAPVRPIASASASSFRSGSYTTSHPAAARPSMPLFSNLSATSTLMIDSDQMNQQPISQLGLEPRGLGRHDATGVRNRHQVVHRDRVHGE